jgi:FkbM family methyltransferase
MGYDLRKVSPNLGSNVYLDIGTLLTSTPEPVVLDVGANIGQTVERVLAALDRPQIHAFEPSPTTFAELSQNTAGLPGVKVKNCGMGAEPGTLELIENTSSDMTSFLELGDDGWGETRTKTPVQVLTVDDYCRDQSIESIDLLKSDTQGYDLEVLKGASEMLEAGRIRFLLLELNFDESYRQMPRMDSILTYVFDRGFRVVSFYNFHHHADRASWADGLFIYAPAGEVAGLL